MNRDIEQNTIRIKFVNEYFNTKCNKYVVIKVMPITITDFDKTSML